MNIIDAIDEYKSLKEKGLLTPEEDNKRFRLEQYIKDNIVEALLNDYQLVYRHNN